jgi:hypothetical protein
VLGDFLCPSLSAKGAATRDGVSQTLKVACGEGLIDSLEPLAMPHRRVAAIQSPLTTLPRRQARPLPLLRARHEFGP